MSLTYKDLQEIRTIVEETIKPVQGQIQALNEDIKEIYNMISELQKSEAANIPIENLSLEKKILKLYAELVVAAKQAGVKLPN